MPESSPWHSGNPLFPGTSDLPTLAAKTTRRALPPSPESSGWFPSPCELPAKPHRSWWLRAVVQCSRHAGVTPGWCLRPTVPVPDDDLNAPSIQWVENSNIQLTDEPVQTHTSTAPAHLSSRPLHRETSATQHPSPRTRCTMVVIHVEYAVTLANARGQWEREKEAPAQPHPEWLWVDASRTAGGQCCQCC